MKKDHFAVRADEYDSTDYRLRYVDEMAQSILERIPMSREMTIVDFGAGTGLLSERIAPHVGRIIAIDVSPSMIAKLREKKENLPCELELLQMDLSREEYRGDRVDGIVSSMTLHHIEDVPALFGKFKRMLKPGGFLALCDIDTEDGTFHTVDTGVKHYGFDRLELRQWCEKEGFEKVKVDGSALIRKPHGEYQAFVLTALAPE